MHGQRREIVIDFVRVGSTSVMARVCKTMYSISLSLNMTVRSNFRSIQMRGDWPCDLETAGDADFSAFDSSQTCSYPRLYTMVIRADIIPVSSTRACSSMIGWTENNTGGRVLEQFCEYTNCVLGGKV